MTTHQPAGAKASKDLHESLTIMWDKLSSEEDSRILSRKLRVRYVVTASLENEHPSKVPAEEKPKGEKTKFVLGVDPDLEFME